ncbi:MAG: carbon-nitrogen hydrolase family protein [SAR324 cluster bacterium]|nr:carbon-nitrogen hydrolase family protein [SAR324 cluster bacterium]
MNKVLPFAQRQGQRQEQGELLLRVGIVQFKPCFKQKDINLQSLALLIDEAVRQRANIIILPEMCTTGYSFNSKLDISSYLETKEGKSYHFFSKLAKQHSVYIVYGFAEKSGNRCYNSQNLINHQGELVSTYRKKNLFYLDKCWADSGNLGYISVATSLGVIGLGICMDLNITDFSEFHRIQNSQLVAVSSCWLASQDNDDLTYWRDRCAGFTGVLAISNIYGLENGHTFIGKSCIIEDSITVAHCGANRTQVLVSEHFISTKST